MDKYEEIEFVYKMGLERLKSKPGGSFQARCQSCGDSKTNPSKTRLNILSGKSDHLVFHCFNCGLSTNMAGYLKLTNMALYEEYREKERRLALESGKSGSVFKRKTQSEDETKVKINLKYLFKLNEKYFKPANQSKDHINYCKSRQIDEYIDQFYVNVNKKSMYYKMLIIPFYKEDKIYGFQGRAIDQKKFSTFSTNQNAKIYNLFNVDKTRNVYITESIIDSMMIDNSIAMIGADLVNGAYKEISNRIYCYDNDNTGLDRSLKMIEKNEKVFIWPDNIHVKDFNEGICKGVFTKTSLKSIIENNIYEGAAASTRIKFKLMKKQKG